MEFFFIAVGWQTLATIFFCVFLFSPSFRSTRRRRALIVALAMQSVGAFYLPVVFFFYLGWLVLALVAITWRAPFDEAELVGLRRWLYNFLVTTGSIMAVGGLVLNVLTIGHNLTR